MASGDAATEKAAENLLIQDQIPPVLLNEITNSFLQLPYDVRLKLYKKFDNDIRQVMRLTCTDLCSEIDEAVGPVDPLRLKTKAQTPDHILTFIQTCVFEGLEIKVPAMEFSFEEIITSPLALRSFKFLTDMNENGEISAEFADALLKNCTNLSELFWQGWMEGELSDFETRTNYPKLKRLILGTTFIYGDFEMHNSVLKRIHAPSLNFLELYLSTDRELNVMMEALFNFLRRHPTLETILVKIENLAWEPVGGSSYEPLFLTNEDKRIFQLFETKRLKIDLRSDYKLNKERQLVGFVNNLTKVEHLGLKIQYNDYFWGCFDQNYPMTASPGNLKSLHLAGRFNNDRGMYLPAEEFPNLQVLIIQNSDMDIPTPPPAFQAFQPHQNMTDNLEVLMLTNFRLPPNLFLAIIKFKKLKHLILTGLDEQGRFDAAVSFQQFLQIIQMRSLEALLIPTTVSNAEEQPAFENLTQSLLRFVSENQGGEGQERGRLYNIADPNNCPFWTVFDSEENGIGHIRLGPKNYYI